MKKLLLAALLVLPLSTSSYAQSSADPVLPGYLTIQACPGGSTPCYHTGVVADAIAGTQTNLTISSATALTLPAGYSLAIIQAQGTNNSAGSCLRWRDDGTAPTTSTGFQLPALGTISYRVTSLPIELIQDSGASCTATVAYYK